MVRPTLVINLNHVELKYYPFMINLDKYNGRYSKKTKDINVKTFKMITNKNEAKTMVICNIFQVIVNANSIVQLAN